MELPGHGADQTPAEALSLTSYVDAVVEALPSEGPVVLVGHSMAGIVISAVAERVPDRVSKLVYIAAYLPRDGESLYQLSQTDTGSLVPRYWRQEQPETYSPAWIDRDGIVAVFGADCSEADQQFLLTTHKPEALGPLATPCPPDSRALRPRPTCVCAHAPGRRGVLCAAAHDVGERRRSRHGGCARRLARADAVAAAGCRRRHRRGRAVRDGAPVSSSGSARRRVRLSRSPHARVWRC